jgi:H+/gluconate symporter-like permease
VVLSTAVLTYGGVSLFIIFFIMYPMALVMHKEANITKKLIPGEIALGAFTFTMTTPGSPQVQNLVPMQFLGTSATAAFIPGWIAGLAMLVIGWFYLEYRKRAS